MPSYIEIIITDADPIRREMAIPELERHGFEGFEEEGMTLKAYIPEDKLDEIAFASLATEHQWQLTRNMIPEQNWNQVWESSFEPVIIDDFCAIRADFHAPVPGVEQEIVITPKMSFGTGHHATTYLMIARMRTLPMTGKRVVDFGTGTGVLAILAERLGAATVWALDNDPWSMENALENKDRNGAVRMTVHLASDLVEVPVADIVLANINRHVLLEQMPALAGLLAPGGLLLLSGILFSDEQILGEAAGDAGFTQVDTARKEDWVSQLWQK